MDKFTIKDMNLYYGKFHALKSVNFNMEANRITAFIGPSGCGKSTLLISLNRMNDLVEVVKLQVISVLITRIFTAKIWMLMSSEKEWVWFFKRQTHFL